MGWQDYKADGRHPEKETEKERVSDDNRDRAGRSGLSANLDLQREGHGDAFVASLNKPPILRPHFQAAA
jgi:hypothetical protein